MLAAVRTPQIAKLSILGFRVLRWLMLWIWSLEYDAVYSGTKSKFHRRTGHECPEEEYVYIRTLSLTSALDEVSGQRHAPAVLPPGKRLGAPLYRRLCGLQDGLGRIRKISSPPGFDPHTVHPVVLLYTD
jgi:hypothetical protein